jgi:hypothetical protein
VTCCGRLQIPSAPAYCGRAAAGPGIHWTKDAGKTWNRLKIPGAAYYPRSVQAANGRIFVFGHIGGDNAYGKVDQSIVMDSFRLVSK